MPDGQGMQEGGELHFPITESPKLRVKRVAIKRVELMFLPASFWHNSETASVQTIRRLYTPLHYQLRRHDYISFQQKLRDGTSPFVLDECGRTPLDLALLMVEDLLVTVLCTSFPVDVLAFSIKYDAQHPAKFNPDYASCYSSMYDHLNLYRVQENDVLKTYGLTYGTGSPNELSRVTPVRFPFYKHCAVPRLIPPSDPSLSPRTTHNDVTGSPLKKEIKSRPQRKQMENDKRSSSKERRAYADSRLILPPYQSFLMNGDASFAPTLFPPNATPIQHVFHHDLTFVVRDALYSTFEDKVQKRMTMILSELSALSRIIGLLVTHMDLHQQAIKFRSLLSKYGTHREPNEHPSSHFVLEYITFPYLFFGTLEVLFELYPYGPQKIAFDPLNPTHGRRIVNLVLKKRLRGHGVVSFLVKLLKYVSLLYMALSLDSPALFDIVCQSCDAFSIPDQYKWRETIECLLVFREKFEKHLASRVQATPSTSSSDKAKRPDANPIIQQTSLFNCTLEDFIKGFEDILGKIENVETITDLHEWWQRKGPNISLYPYYVVPSEA